MADDVNDLLRNLLNSNQILESNKKKSGEILKDLHSWVNALTEFYNLQLQNKQLTEEQKNKLTEQYNINKNDVELQIKLLELRKKSLSDIKEDIALEAQKTRNAISRLKQEREMAITTEQKQEKTKSILENEEKLSKLTERQEKIDKDSEIRANKLLNLSRAYKDTWSNLTKEKQKQADLAKEELDNLIKAREEGANISDEQVATARKKATSAANKAELASQLESIMGGVLNKISSALSSIDGRIKDAVSVYSNNFGKVNARLQTIDNTNAKTYLSIKRSTEQTIGASSFVNYKNYMESVEKLSAEGISYNIEERAFFDTVSDKMVASFNVLDASLLRMTRLQQADMTRLMLGNEATLTKLFNEFFEDSSYLAQNISDNISASVFEAASTMNSASASAFEFTVQKWLGALYEVGVSQETVSSIASAINALGSGNAQDFMSSPVSVLLNMAIARGDYSLSDVLTQGLNSDFIDDMMSSMITLLTDIKDNTSNQVTLAAYSNVLGMSVADVRGFTNLKNDLNNLMLSQDANEANEAVINQIRELNMRTTVKERIDNAIDNLFFSRGMELATDNGAYLGYVIGDFVESIAGGTTVGLIGTAAKLASVLGAKGKEIDWAEYSTWDLITDIFSTDIVGNISNMIKQINGFFHDSTSLNSALSGNAYVRYERGADFLGVSPDYTSLYGKVSSGESRSMGITNNTSILSSEGSYTDNSIYSSTSENANFTTENKIDELTTLQSGTVDPSQYFSQESKEAMTFAMTESDFYREIFKEHNYPIWIDFAPDTIAFLKEWYKLITDKEDQIHDRQHDTHVTNTVNVSGSVDIAGSGLSQMLYAIRGM